jgi:hypothetical protein
VHLRGGVHDAIATDRLRATDEMEVFGSHPCKRSNALATGFPDSLVEKQHCRPSRSQIVRGGSQRRLDGDACFEAIARLWSSPYTGPACGCAQAACKRGLG